LRGPGETQLEVDRREISRRITTLRRELERVRTHRQQYRRRRRKSAVPTVALVGYTNAGKSTLLNRLAGADIYVADKLFATLDPTTRRIELPGGQHLLMTDTVGFIQKLPATLVAAFRATLEEITEADLLLHVLDVTHPSVYAHALAVRQTLAEIGATDLPVVTALNKIDLLSDRSEAEAWVDEFDRAVPISAQTGEGLDHLLQVLEEELYLRYLPITAVMPYGKGDLVSLFHEHGIVERIEHTEKAIEIEGRIPVRLRGLFQPYLVEKKELPATVDPPK
jgi:GTP-binding protein HflX